MNRLIAVDLGNSRAKFGCFDHTFDSSFPVPISSFVDAPGDFVTLCRWLETLTSRDSKEEDVSFSWSIARTGNFPWETFQEKLEKQRPGDRFKELDRWDIPCAVEVEFPEKVGIDRILAVYGAIAWWKNRPEYEGHHSLLLVVDAGSATTIDLATTRPLEASEGAFAGGAIIPGFDAAAEALHGISPRLPRISTENLSFASYPGINTEEALAAGIYWGAVGAIRHFYQSVQAIIDGSNQPHPIPIFLAGGDAEKLHNGLSMYLDPERLILLPDLVLDAIALAVRSKGFY